MSNAAVKDLLILAADKDAEFALRGLLSRPQAVGIRSIEYDIFTHPEHDPGCRTRAKDLLRMFSSRYGFALVLFDLEGSGRESTPRESLESSIEQDLEIAGWRGRAAVVAIEPELEIWIWSDSPHVDSALGWAKRQPSLRDWLSQRGFLIPPALKPTRPKEAMRAALREVTKAPSPATFQELAKSVSFARCSDAAFHKLLSTLRRWFPPITS